MAQSMLDIRRMAAARMAGEPVQTIAAMSPTPQQLAAKRMAQMEIKKREKQKAKDEKTGKGGNYFKKLRAELAKG